MTLLQIRELFREASGRYDLYDAGTAGSAFSDIFLIQQGSRYLDERYPQPENFRWYKLEANTGDFRLVVPDLILAKEVWAMESGGNRFQLTYKPLGFLKSQYAKDSSSLDTGAPKYWSNDLIMLAPDQIDLGAADFSYDADELLFDPTLEKRGILWMPPLDATYMISILGEFYSESLTLANDINPWSVKFPMALVHAALLALERFYRNFEGVRDQAANIADLLTGPEYSTVERETVGLANSQMQG